MSPTPLMGSNKLGVAGGWSSSFEQQMRVESSLDETDSSGALHDTEAMSPPGSPTKLKYAPSFRTILNDYKVQGPDRFEAVFEENPMLRPSTHEEEVKNCPSYLFGVVNREAYSIFKISCQSSHPMAVHLVTKVQHLCETHWSRFMYSPIQSYLIFFLVTSDSFST